MDMTNSFINYGRRDASSVSARAGDVTPENEGIMEKPTSEVRQSFRVDSKIAYNQRWTRDMRGEENDLSMRQYMRHPNDVPIACAVTDNGEGVSGKRLRDIGHGGLSFVADAPIRNGAHVHIKIPVEQPPFEVDGTVVWCRPGEAEHYDVGVEFSTETVEFSVRMVEQICQIEHYRNEVLHHEGRELTCEQAAVEWIANNADTFPR
jgi:hypothetical protein